jgi:glycosyltransferase involved in cell wall biosynthesis
MVRFSVVEPSGNLYGSEFALLDLLGGLELDAFRAEVVLPRGAPLTARLREAGVPVLELLPAGGRRVLRWKKALSYWRLMTHWRRSRPDLVYINQAGILRPIAIIARRLRLPVLCQVQTVQDARWVAGLPSYHRHVSAFVCNSRFTAENACVPANRLCTVYQGYRRKGLCRKGSVQPRQPGRLEAGLLGRICQSKGHDLVVQAAQHLRHDQGVSWHFRFIGDAINGAELARVRSLVAEAGVADRVEFRGYQTDVAGELAQLDLLLIPSLADAFPRTLLEAAEAQVPVLLSEAEGLGEAARHFNIGVRFPGGELAEFVARLQFIGANYAAVRREFLTASERMLRALDFRAYVAVMEGLIQRAVAGDPVSINWLGAEDRPAGLSR